MEDLSVTIFGVKTEGLFCHFSERIYTENVLTDTGKRGIFWPIIFFAIQVAFSEGGVSVLIIQGFLYWVLVFLSETSLFTNLHKIWKSCWNFMEVRRKLQLSWSIYSGPTSREDPRRRGLGRDRREEEGRRNDSEIRADCSEKPRQKVLS